MGIGSKREALIRGWRKSRNKRYNDIFCASNVVRLIKPRNERLVGNGARTGEKRYAYRVWLGHVKERDHLQDLGIYRDIIKMDLNKMSWESFNTIRSGQGHLAGSFKSGDGLSGFVKYERFS